jgi:rhodanese-related sulfurtransferase
VGVSTVDPHHAAEAIRAGALVLDVRAAAAFERDGLAGARHLPLERVRDGPPPDALPRGTPIFVVCERGLISELATLYLRDAGYEAFNVSGGLRALRPLLATG